MIGEEGILKELELAGFQYLGGPVCQNINNFHVTPQLSLVYTLFLACYMFPNSNK